MKRKLPAYITGGLSQADRFPESLDPDFFRIDERDTNDFLQYLLAFSKHLEYYAPDNRPDGDWEDFLLSDINIVVKIITKFDISTCIRRYDSLKARIGREVSEKGLVDGLRNLFQFIYEFLLFQVKLHERFSSIPADEIGITEFRRVVHEYDSYEEELVSLNAWLRHAKRHFGDELKVRFDARQTRYVESHMTDDDDAEADIFTEVENLKDKVVSGLRNFDTLFARLRSKYYRLQEAAEVFIHKRESLGAVYLPHTGLLMAFLDLYAMVQKNINGITARHLDYYYRDILGLSRRKAEPDKVYLLMNIHPAQQKVVIDKGEELLIDKPGLTANNVFAVDTDTVLTRASIKALRSIYVSEGVKLAAKTDTQNNIYEQQVFVADNPVHSPAAFISQDPTLYTWPLMGEDQEDISKDLMTMQPADIGLVVASPLLYAKDGKRLFHIRLYLSQSSFFTFTQYVYDYAEVAAINPKVVMHNMLKDAFYLDITGEEDWISINRYNINCELDGDSDKCIDIFFELTASDPSTGIYDPKLHGKGYDETLPMLRMKVNNSSFYNPYTFFKGIILERISIRLSVEESKQVKLRNNVGEVSIVNPFQLFGPQPAIGSYLDIKNSNIFNKYTSDFSVSLHWFDLPKEKGGFETYYSAYPGHIRNESFKAGLSGINEGRFYPEVKDQQTFNLFTNRTEAGEKAYLSNTTVMNDVDFLRVRFDNGLSMEKEAEPEANFKEGAIKLELVAPQDAFGHRTYSSLFPEVVMHNGKRFIKKRSLPNQPYIPVLKSVTINYELEHSESLSGAAGDDDVFLWHIHPFGYKKIYPGKNTAAFRLIPDYPCQSNLLIGLEDVMPGELLSLLFKFEESNFSAFNYHPEDIQWSILHENEWIPIPKSDILQDETVNFIKSGMVTLRLPDLAGRRNTILDPQLYWIRACCNSRGEIRSKTQGVFVQAVPATRILTEEQDLDISALFITPGTLTQLRNKNPRILTVSQPFVSFGGRSMESERQYYIRVSEQLRHKNRAITAMDISQLVLDAFPDIMKVKCIETEVNGQTVMPGVDLLVIVILNQYTGTAAEIQEYPKVDLSRLFRIKQFLAGMLSPFTRVEVVNPVYEKIKVVCSVVFHSDNDQLSAAKQSRAQESNGILLQKLNDDIKKWISPWLYNKSANVNTEGKIYVSEILNFIKRCPYVSYVTGFSVLHFYQVYDVRSGEFYDRMLDSAVTRVEYLSASLPNALLVSAPEHAVTVLDKPYYIEQGKTGISGMAIGKELIVADANEYDVLKEEQAPSGDEGREYNFYFYTP